MLRALCGVTNHCLTANLATFTQYHAITNRYNFWSYIAFFIVLWSSWFHVVCFDARFTSDSVWERACKTVHFCSFAAFALAGYKFMPVAKNVQSATPLWVISAHSIQFLNCVLIEVDLSYTMFRSPAKSRMLSIPIHRHDHNVHFAQAHATSSYPPISAECTSLLIGCRCLWRLIWSVQYRGQESLGCAHRSVRHSPRRISWYDGDINVLAEIVLHSDSYWRETRAAWIDHHRRGRNWYYEDDCEDHGQEWADIWSERANLLHCVTSSTLYRRIELMGIC
jgi:hypothetical protein